METTEIAYSLVALLVGIAAGWGIFRWRHGDAVARHDAIVAERDADIARLEAELSERDAQLENVQSNLDTFRDSLGRIDGTVDVLKSQLGEALHVIEQIDEPPGLLAAAPQRAPENRDGYPADHPDDIPPAPDEPDATTPPPERNPREDRP